MENILPKYFINLIVEKHRTVSLPFVFLITVFIFSIQCSFALPYVYAEQNNDPSALSQSITTSEDQLKFLTLNATDSDGDTLTYILLTQPSNGNLTGTAPDLTYTPNPNYNGADSFTFKVNDGTVDSNMATVSITVDPVNDTPSALSQSITTSEDQLKFLTLNATDSDVPAQTLSYTILTQPSNGNLTGTAPDLTYTPNPNYNGADSFTFKVNDGGVISNNATISITVSAVNDDGIVVYRSNTGTGGLSTPKIKIWGDNGNGNFGNEVTLPTAGSPIRHLVIKNSPISEKNVLVTQSDDGWLDAYICITSCDQSSSWIVTNNIAQVASAAINQKRFDVQFETSTGDALVVYSVLSTNSARDLAYKILPISSNSFAGIPEQYIDDNSANGGSDLTYTWVSLARKPIVNSEELTIVGFDSTGSDTNAWIWSGTSWGNRQEITATATATAGEQAIGVQYALDGTKAMVLSGDGTSGNMATWYWSGSAWINSADFDIDTSDTLDAKWVTVKADPVSDDLQVVVVDSGSDLTTAYWSGSAWTVTSNIETSLDVNTARPADFAWNPSGSTGKLVWDSTVSSTSLSQRTCSPSCTGTTSTISTYSGTGSWLTLHTNPDVSNNVDIVGMRLNNAFDVGSFRWDGNVFTNYGDSQMTADTTVTTFEAYSFDFT